MNQLLDQLFGLGDMRFGGEGVEFRFAREFPAWAWAGVVGDCCGSAIGGRGWGGAGGRGPLRLRG